MFAHKETKPLSSVSFRETKTVWITPDSKISYWESSIAHEKHMLFIHGWGLSPRSYYAPLSALSEWAHIYAPSLPGFGQSSLLAKSVPPSLQAYAHAILTAWETAEWPTPMPIVAHSMGSGVAVKMAVEHPEMVSSLTLTCPIGGDADMPVSWGKLATSMAHEIASGAFTTRIFDGGPSLFLHPRTAARSAYVAKTARLSQDIYTLLKQQIPVTLIIAKDDGVVQPGHMPYTGANVVEVHGNHGFLLHEPEQYSKLVEKILLSHEG